MLTRQIRGIDEPISALGMGCWAIGGAFLLDGKNDGWGKVDDAESIRAIHRALDFGVNFFDTADAYGAGHSERLLGAAFKGRREQVVIATKFGFTYDEDKRELLGTDVSPIYIRWACEQSLRRLNTDYLDLYQLHCGASPSEAQAIFDALDKLVTEGKIRAYGWSTGDPNNAQLVASRNNAGAIQHGMNVLSDAKEILDVCSQYELISVTNSPLANGLLSGKYSPNHQFLSDDFRGAGHEWATSFETGYPKREIFDKLDAIRDILTMNGRSLVQGALAWIWGRSDRTLPIPGFKTVAQVEENCRALQFGALSDEQMQEIHQILHHLETSA